jgi:Protein of unknown function (DUF2690)
MKTNKTVRRFVATCVAALVMASAALPAQAETQTRVGCVGAACRGKDPAAMGCDHDARTLASAHGNSFRIELRYSPRCNARWARTTYLGYVDAYPFWVYAQLGSGAVTYREGAAPLRWSRMWTDRIRACGGAVGGESPFAYGTKTCTAAR